MKTLFLMRHAKSSWDLPQQKDFDRPLNERGQRAAPLMGRYLRRQKLRPDLILCSPAERARQTAELFIAAAHLTTELRFDERIYDASADNLLQVFAQIDNEASAVLVIGHNPGMEELILRLTGHIQRMPTAALALIELNIERWADARAMSGQLVWLKRPKELTTNDG
ncbi:MAG: histidine phosphatase family protein [Acidobacteriota bacterium]|nr:histidine phosphatase family protein [Acidobacteriota bacterium]